jgi:hypothetical protein
MVICEVVETPRGQPAGLPPSSSEEVGSSRAVMKDSALDDGPFVLSEVIRPLTLGRCILATFAGCGGVTSGVGGPRWSGGVAGGRLATTCGSPTLCSVLVGLDGVADWPLEDAFDSAGGVGGRSGPVPILLSWGFKGWELITGRGVELNIG